MLALLDFDDFHDMLLDATRDLLIRVRAEYSDQQLYAFYLFHDPLWGFMVPRISIEGGIKPFPPLGYIIKQAINLTLRTPSPQPAIQTDQHPHDFNLAHRIGREYFEDVNMWLLRAQFYRVTFTHKQMEQYHRTMTAVAIDVLQALDKRGLFGDDDQRQHTLVNLVMLKDPNREWIHTARELNPPEVYQRWVNTL